MDLEAAIRQLLQNSQGQENGPKSEGTSSGTTTDTGTGGEAVVPETATGEIKTNLGSTDDLTAEVAVKMEGLLTLEMIKEMKEKKGANKAKVVKPRSRKSSEADAQDNWRAPNNNLQQNDNNNPPDHSNNNFGSFAGSTTGGAGRRLRRYGSGDHSGAEDDQNDENKWGFFGKKNYERNAKKLAAKAAAGGGDEGENENAFEDGVKCAFEKKKSFNFTDEPSLNYAIRQPRGPDVGGGIGFAVRRQLVDKDMENIP